MKKIFIILAVILTKASFGQVSGNYYDIPELKKVSILNDIQLSGTFRCDVGLEQVILNLDSSSNFNNYLYSCDGKELLDSGNWRLNGIQIALTGVKYDKYFDILQFDEYYILVPHEYKEQFIKEMKSILKEVKRATMKEYDFVGYVLEKLSIIVYIKKASSQ